MSDVLLNGKVRVQRLPRFEGPPGADAPALKRLCLSQGELAQLTDRNQAFRYLAVVQLLAGATRGNHYHAHKQEFVYVISGSARLFCVDRADGSRCEAVLETGSLAFISAGVAHALTTEIAGWAVEYSPEAFDARDVYPMAAMPASVVG